MGQGVNVKIRQLVADEFGLDPDRVRADAHEHGEEQQHVADGRVGRAPTSTAPRPCDACRADQAAAAAIRGRAAGRRRRRASTPRRVARAVSPTDACYDSRRPDVRIAFGQLCAEARRERVDLGARGFYATPGVDFNRETGRGTPFFYYTQGAAVARSARSTASPASCACRASIC